MSESLSSDERTVCPECMVEALSHADGPFVCTNCGWSEEDEEPMDDATRYAVGAM